jgi:hypothetical protein
VTLAECTALLAPVAVTLGVQVDAPTFRAYHRALADVPLPLLQAACEAAQRAPREPYEPRWPTAPTFRRLAEQARQAWLAARPWEPCEACAESPRFVETLVDGVPRLSRCPCWTAHQRLIDAAGIQTQIALPPAREEASA